MRFEIGYHSISGYDYVPDYQNMLFSSFEKKGYVGLTTSDTSPWELREIRRWIKKQKEHMYMNRNEWFDTTDEDGYTDNCNCYWFSNNKQRENFIKLLDTFPERKHEVEFETANEQFYYAAEEAFRKQQYTNNCRFVEHSTGKAVVQFSNEAAAVAFKLKYI